MSVDDIRRTIDALDNQVHDLLMQRAEMVLKIGEEKRKNNVQVIQPDREIVMIRRLLARHHGPLPREAVVRIWRELVGAVSLLQTGLKVAVCAPDNAAGLMHWDVAKDYFSSLLPMHKAGDPATALAAVREGKATFAVLPWPEDKGWWSALLDETGEKPLRIMARLPLGDRSEKDDLSRRALAVARLRFDPSGDDRCFIGLDLKGDVSRARIMDVFKDEGLPPRGVWSAGTRHLAEADGYVAVDDAKLTTLAEKLGGRVVALGGYPVPPVYGDKVGKNVANPL